MMFFGRPRTTGPDMRRISRLNQIAGLCLVALVLLSAVPLASNRPVWWAIWGAVLGFGGALYYARSAMVAANRASQTSHFRTAFIVAAVVPVWAVLQCLPIGWLVPNWIASLPAVVPPDAYPASLSLMPSASLFGALRLASYLLFVALVLEVATRSDRIELLARILFYGIAAHGVWALVALNLLNDFVFWGEKRDYLGAATGTFVNRNSFATFQGFGIILGIALLMAPKMGPKLRRSRPEGFLGPENLMRMWNWGLVLAMVLALLATQSRLGTAATAVGAMLTFTLMRIKSGEHVVRAGLRAGAIILALGVVATIMVGTGLMDRMLYVELEGASRLEIYRQALGMLADRAVTGFGLDTFAMAFQLYRADPLMQQGMFDLAHNSYITNWVEMGVIVGSLPLVALAMALRAVIGNLRLSDSRAAAVPAASLGVLVLGAIHSLGDFSLEIPANVFAFLFLLGLGMSKRRER